MSKQTSVKPTVSPVDDFDLDEPEGKTPVSINDVVICGPGRVGSALLLSFMQAGLNLHVFSRLTAMATDMGPAVWFVCVPDSAVESVVCELFESRLGFRAEMDHCVVVSATSDIADLSMRCGGVTNVCRAHPLYPFPPPESSTALPVGTPFATENASEAVLQVLLRIGAVPFELDPGKRYLYHAAAVMISNLPGALWYAASRILADCGVPSPEGHAAMMLQRLAASLAHGGPDALPGPAARGDKETVQMDQAAVDRYDEDLATVHRILSEIIANDMFGVDKRRSRN